MLAILQRRGVLIGLFAAALLAALDYVSEGIAYVIGVNSVLTDLANPLTETIGWIVFASSVLIGARRVRPLAPRGGQVCAFDDLRYATAIGIGLAIVALGNVFESRGSLHLDDGALIIIATGYAVIAVTLFSLASKLHETRPGPVGLRGLFVAGGIGVALGIIPDLVLVWFNPDLARGRVILFVEGLRAASLGTIGVVLLVASLRTTRRRPASQSIGIGLVIAAIGIALIGLSNVLFSTTVTTIGLFAVAFGDGTLAFTALRAAARTSPRVDWRVGERTTQPVEAEPLWAGQSVPS